MKASFMGAAAALALAVLATNAAAAREPIEIGLITTLSGPGGYLGQDIRDGFQLAADMQGGMLGGVPVKIMVEDDGLNPGKGRQIADRFLNDDKIKLFTGIVFSNVLEATVPEILDNGGIYVSANAAPSNFAGKDCNKNYYVVSWQNDALHESAGQNATDLGYKNVFVLAPNYQAGKDAIAGFKRFFKGKIGGEVYTSLGQTDFASDMAQIRAAKPDAVFEFEPGGLGIAFLRQYQEAGLLGTIPLVVAAPSVDAVILKALGDAALGINVSAFWNTDFDNPANHAFMTAWTKAYHRVPTYYAAQAYDTALAIGAALKHDGGTVDNADAFRAAMLKADFHSVRGKFKFGNNQEPIQDWFALRVVKGPDGKPIIKTLNRIMTDRGDAYSHLCPLTLPPGDG